MKKIVLCLCCFCLTACQSKTPDFHEQKVIETTIPPVIPEEMPLDVPEEIESLTVLDLFPELTEGNAHLEKLGFNPFLFEEYLLVCVVGNGTVFYSGYTSDIFMWTGDIFLENDDTLEVFSDDLVYFESGFGTKYQLTTDGFVFLEPSSTAS